MRITVRRTRIDLPFSRPCKDNLCPRLCVSTHRLFAYCSAAKNGNYRFCSCNTFVGRNRNYPVAFCNRLRRNLYGVWFLIALLAKLEKTNESAHQLNLFNIVFRSSKITARSFNDQFIRRIIGKNKKVPAAQTPCNPNELMPA